MSVSAVAAVDDRTVSGPLDGEPHVLPAGDVREERADNPDQRISEDIRLFVSQTLSFFSGLLKALTTLVCFIFILWDLSGSLAFSALGREWHISGYLVWAALIYSVFGTWITYRVGNRLVGLIFHSRSMRRIFVSA